jgi:hypothetical protein
VVSDDPNKYKIFEFYVNKLQFPESDADTDLFIALTPCTGSLKFYISDTYENLFTERSEVVTDFDTFGLIDASPENAPEKYDGVRVVSK